MSKQKHPDSLMLSQQSAESLKSLELKLTPAQRAVIIHSATEPPFQNEYWDTSAPGIYIDRLSGDVLFTSLEKFDSGCGWPSFSKPSPGSSISYEVDDSQGLSRIEVRTRNSMGHLGHVFMDGPGRDGLRYCINSAAVEFIAFSDLLSRGYGAFRQLFEGDKSLWPDLIMAGGCFWGMEELFRKQPGVIDTEVAYAGGDSNKNTYAEVKLGNSGHAEAVRVWFDPHITSAEALIHYFFKIHDPTTPHGQGADIGSQYRSVIFYRSPQEKELALSVMNSDSVRNRWPQGVVTRLESFTTYVLAEPWHQKYLIKNPAGYSCHFERD